MKKAWKLIFGFILIGILSATLIMLKQQNETENEKSEEKTETVLFSSEYDELSEISFLADNREMIFKKEGENWQYEEDPDFPVSNAKMESLGGYLNPLSAERVLVNVEDLSEYGLDSPQNILSVRKKDGSSVTFEIGDKNTSVSQYYVLKDDDQKTVYLVSENYLSSFAGTLYDFAEGDKFPVIDAKKISKVSVSGKNSYILEKDENSMWNISDNVSRETSDTLKADTFLSSVASLSFKSFVNYDASEKEIAEYGLDEKSSSSILIEYTEENGQKNEEENKEENKEENDIDHGSENTDTVDEPEYEKVDEKSDRGAEEKADSVKMENDLKEIILYIGNSADSSSHYVRIKDHTDIYTMLDAKLNQILNKSVSDFLRESKTE